jgi:hypothetical protein
MKRHALFVITLLCTLAFGLSEASAQGKGDKGKGKGKSSTSDKGKKGPSKDKGSSKDKGKDSSKDKGKDKKDDKGSSKNKDDKDKKGKDKKDDDWRHDSKFKDKDRDDLLSHWDKYKGDNHGLPPGLAKNLRRGKPLPPGWEKKVKSGWKVDDEWWDRFDRVPNNYLPKDFKLPKDTGMFLLGDRMVRVHEPSREVIDFVRIPSIKRD